MPIMQVPINFLKPVSDFECSMLMKSDDQRDIRVIKFVIQITPQPLFSIMEFKCPAGKEIIQFIKGKGQSLVLSHVYVQEKLIWGWMFLLNRFIVTFTIFLCHFYNNTSGKNCKVEYLIFMIFYSIILWMCSLVTLSLTIPRLWEKKLLHYGD